MAPDGFDGDGDLESRNSAGKEASLKQEFGCSPCQIDYTSPSQNKKVDESSCLHDNLPSRFQYGENSKGHEEADGQIPLSSDNKGKHFSRKSAREPISIAFKRPRVDDSENCLKNNGTNGHVDISGMAGFDPIRCTADKSQTISQKRVHDGKRADKKNCRASLKNKYESLASKAGLICSDTFSGGNSILGSHGVKSDIHYMAKQFDELSLFDLINGSYRYPMLPVDKGKKSVNANDNILLSVRRACSILCPPHVLAESGSNSKACQGFQDPNLSTGNTSDYGSKDKQLDESLKKGKVQDTLQANWFKSTIHQPKKILDQLALPASRELETFLFNSSVCSTPQFTEKSKCCGDNNLPPFHWSFSHGACSKPSVESCKVNATKNACQGKWVRIGSSSSLTTGYKSYTNFIPGLVITSDGDGDDTDSLNKQKIDGVLEWMKSFTPLQSLSEGPSSKSCIVGIQPEVHVEDNMNSVNGSGLLEIARTLDRSLLECDSGGHAPQEAIASVVSRCSNDMNLDSSKFNLTFKDKAVLKDHPAGTIDGCFLSSFSYTCRNATAGPCDNSCPYCRILKCKQAYPQELLSAAATLLEMGQSYTVSPKCLSGRNKWPKTPSMKKMKSRKSSTSIENPDISYGSTCYNNPIRKTNISSAEHQSTIHRKMDFVPPSSSGRESSTWSSSPNKADKDLNHRFPHGNITFRPFLTPFSSRTADKNCDNQFKEPQSKPPSVLFKGSSIRDWIRCRNKRL